MEEPPYIVDNLERVIKMLFLLGDTESQALGKKVLAFYLSQGFVDSNKWLEAHPFYTAAEWSAFSEEAEKFVLEGDYILDRIETWVLEGYAYKDIVRVEPGDVVIDAGAFTGNTVIYFSQKAGKNGCVHAFEAHPSTFQTLSTNIKLKNIQNTILYNQAISDKEESLCFSKDGKPGSRIIDKGGIEIPCTSIDLWAEREQIKKIDFIKMDIEGAELAALTGAEKVIKKFQPKMAICIYHKPEDSFSIPEKVLSFCPNYTLYLKHNSLTAYETVLFFCPCTKAPAEPSVPDLSVIKALYRSLRKNFLYRSNMAFFEKLILLLEKWQKAIPFSYVFDTTDAKEWMRIPFSNNGNDRFVVSLKDDVIKIIVQFWDAKRKHTEQELADIQQALAGIKAQLAESCIGEYGNNVQLDISIPRIKAEDQSTYTASILEWVIKKSFAYFWDKGLLSGKIILPFLEKEL